MRIKVTAFILFLLYIVPAFAESPVWKISKDGNHLFIGGTIHVLSESDYPLPEAFDFAFNNSTQLVLEANLQKIEGPQFLQEILQNGTYQTANGIVDYLQPDTVRDLKNYSTDRGIPFESLLMLKPGFLMAMLTTVELQRLGQLGTGVDKFYSLKALDEGRETEYLETISDQVRFISEIGQNNEDEFVKYLLSSLDEISEMLQSLKNAWRTGNNDQMQVIGIDSLKEQFPKTFKSIVTDRNNKWIPQIEIMLRDKDVELVLFGALHLVGEEGVLSQLEKLGYTVENI